MRTAAKSLIFPLAIMMIAASHAYAEIAWQTNLRAAHAQAQQEGKLLLLHFYTDNCAWCDRLEAGSFRAPQVNEAIGRSFVPVKIHAGTSPKLAEMFKVNRFPTDVVVTTDGETLVHKVSPQDPQRYVAMLVSSLSGKPSAQIATAPNNQTPASPAVETTAATPSPTTTAPGSTASVTGPTATESAAASVAQGDVPGYAVAEAPSPSPSITDGGTSSLAATAQAKIQAPTSNAPAAEFTVPNLELPNSDVGTGTQAQLAAARVDGLSLEMPAQVQSAPTPDSYNVTKMPQATATSESTLAQPTAVETSAPVAAKSTSDDKPELAMQGFCPVTVIGEDKWIEGDVEFGVIHLGKLYLFSSNEKMQTFLDDPVPYTPVLNGIDVVRFFEERKIVQGKREWGLKDPIHNRMFFFADEAAMNHFYEQYERYTDAAIEVMEKAVKDANPGA